MLSTGHVEAMGWRNAVVSGLYGNEDLKLGIRNKSQKQRFTQITKLNPEKCLRGTGRVQREGF